MKTLSQLLYNSILQNGEAVSLSSDGVSFRYSHLAGRIAFLQSGLFRKNNEIQSIGIIANQDFDTYSTILACLLSGITYIPIEPGHPDERNNHIISIAEIEVIYCSGLHDVNESFYNTHKKKFVLLPEGELKAENLKKVPSGNPAYILFTSGSTGVPKGVPIRHENLLVFAQNVEAMNLGITPAARFLQVFDLTFDLSVFSFLVPLLHGASVYLLPKTPLKFMMAVQLIEDESITHVLSVPSFVNHLRPYFDEINLPSIHSWLFCGEALKADLVTAWQPCVANATIYNVYGPTEATIFCTSYICAVGFKEMHGIVCIGKPFTGTGMVLADENGTCSDNCQNGELLISGAQLTEGYLKNPEKNRAAFPDTDGKKHYRTGDICMKDKEGDFFFLGRNDSQVKIQGFRVELGEIEYFASLYPGITEVVVTASSIDQKQILQLFYTAPGETDEKQIRSFLAAKLPGYMVPPLIMRIDKIPYNLNGKVDKLALQKLAL